MAVPADCVNAVSIEQEDILGTAVAEGRKDQSGGDSYLSDRVPDPTIFFHARAWPSREGEGNPSGLRMFTSWKPTHASAKKARTRPRSEIRDSWKLPPPGFRLRKLVSNLDKFFLFKFGSY